MVELVRLTAADYPEMVQEANKIFSGKQDQDGNFTYNDRYFQDLLPKLYRDGRTMADHYAIRQEGRLVAQAGAFPDTMVVCKSELKVRGIGTVGVDQACRGSGYMIRLMDKAMEDMIADGVDLSLLGGQRQRYEHWNYTPAGTAIQFLYTPIIANALNGKGSHFGYSFVPVVSDGEAVAEKMYQLHSKLPVRCLRRRDQFVTILCTWKNLAYQIVKDGEFAGYLVTDGQHHVVHELLLENESELDQVLNDFVRMTEQRVWLCVNPWETERIQRLSEYAGDCQISKSEMFRIFCFRRVLQAFLDLKSTYTRLMDGELTIAVDNGETLKISVRENQPLVEVYDGPAQLELTQIRATRLFFSHMTMMGTYDCELPQCAQNWFPLPLSFALADGV